jgi:VIT1/CCC1 family predicted Fe2+/Mn2+ transporter
MGTTVARSGTGPRGRLPHPEHHRTQRVGWLRAAVLGANDGIISTASLIVGVAAADANRATVLTAGTAGLVAGAMSMAVGEFVSVSSQRDTEQADLAQERRELAADPESELNELTRIYERRGLDPPLAAEVARQLTHHDALAAHVRDELGITGVAVARPLQAAWSSAASFTVGALLPLLAALASPSSVRVGVVAAAALVTLAVLGAMGARLGGAPLGAAALRITVLGALAMAVTAAIGALVGTAVE